MEGVLASERLSYEKKMLLMIEHHYSAKGLDAVHYLQITVDLVGKDTMEGSYHQLEYTILIRTRTIVVEVPVEK